MLTDFIRKRVQRELDAAKNPKGMSLHSGKVTLEICDVERMLLSAAPTPPEVEPVAMTAEFKGLGIVTLRLDEMDNELGMRFVPGTETKYYTSPPSPKADWFNGDVDCDGNELMTVRKDAYVTRLAYEHVQKHEASWDADGNPMNLEAAARQAELAMSILTKYVTLFADERDLYMSALNNLRKFLPEGK